MTATARWTGLALGLSLALVALVQARVPAGTGEVPAYVSLVAEPAVTLDVAPGGRELLDVRRLTPGRSSSGVIELSNLTDAPVDFEPRLRARRGEAPGALQVRLTAGTDSLYSGRLEDFRASLRLGARASRRLRFRLSMPRGGARDVQGRSVDLVARFAVKEGR